MRKGEREEIGARGGKSPPETWQQGAALPGEKVTVWATGNTWGPPDAGGGGEERSPSQGQLGERLSPAQLSLFPLARGAPVTEGTWGGGWFVLPVIPAGPHPFVLAG